MFKRHLLGVTSLLCLSFPSTLVLLAFVVETCGGCHEMSGSSKKKVSKK